MITPKLPDNSNVKEPGNNACLYLARSNDIAQKFEAVIAPNVKLVFSSPITRF